MSSDRFFVEESAFKGEFVRFSREQAHQISRVLRLDKGGEIIVLDDKGSEYDVTLTQVSAKEAVGRITAKRPASGEPPVEIVLFQSLLAREKFEWVLQKGTEVGVTIFVPMQAERSLLRAKHIEPDRIQRWRRIITEAAEQAHRGRIPQIESPTTLAEAVTRRHEFSRFLIAALSTQAQSLRDALTACAEPPSPAVTGRLPSSVAILIGPEGGFTEEEIKLAVENGAAPIVLGHRVLRTETAAMVAPALILYELERVSDFRL
jgi:16S rRNA (uracil1498-N3)-methyltransferase